MEFKVNKYITLRLENNKTEIYVLDKKFIMCKFLLINIPVEDITSFNDIESIDDAETKLDHSLHDSSSKEFNISPEDEFWAHCSNLQAWAEYNYDTRLLHRDVAFPLLRKLTKEGDQTARRVFKEEVAKRLKSNSFNVVFYLLEGGYLYYFNKDELDLFLMDLNDNNPKLKNMFTDHITNLLKRKRLFQALSGYNTLLFLIVDNRFEFLESLLNVDFQEIDKNDILTIYEFIKKANNRIPRILQKKIIDLLKSRNKEELFNLEPIGAFSLLSIEILKDSFGNQIDIHEEETKILLKLAPYGSENYYVPHFVVDKGKVVELSLVNCSLQTLKNSYEKLESLKILRLVNNYSDDILESLAELPKIKGLEKLIINDNELEVLPDSISALKKLKNLDLFGNKLKTIKRIESIENLNLDYNEIEDLKDICKLKNLRTLSLFANYIETIPYQIKKLHKLEELNVSENKIKKINNSITKIKSLKKIDLRNNLIKPNEKIIKELKKTSEVLL